MKTFDQNQTPSRPRWRTPQLTSDTIGTSTRNDNAPNPATDHSTPYPGSVHHENS
jgi:hypothetical protein